MIESVPFHFWHWHLEKHGEYMVASGAEGEKKADQWNKMENTKTAWKYNKPSLW